jgi:hypothetical protein
MSIHGLFYLNNFFGSIEMQKQRIALSAIYLPLLMLLAVSILQPAQAEVKLKPHVLASQQAGDAAEILNATRASLQSAGFEIAGEYSPFKGTTIVVITNDELKKNAAASTHGGFGAMQRVSVSTVKNEVQVAYTNPVYMANVYRMKGDLSGVRQQLEKALGMVKDFGAEGKTAEQLRKYHYKIFMPYFDDPYELKSFASYDEAVKAVEAGLKAGWGGTTKVYRIDVPGKQESVFGVALTRECSGDEFIMNKIDFAAIKAATHLPYEMMVTGKEVIALHAKFRIAQSFPDLSMVGDNSFFSIMCAPGEIEEALGSVVKGESKSEAW